MIKNERQYRISKAAARKFQQALSKPVPAPEQGIDPMIANATHRAMSAQLSDLETSLRDYEVLKSGNVHIVEVAALEELPMTLIRGRIAMGMTQKDLADRMGLQAQQIQRYEESDYQSASFARLLEVANAMNLNVRHEALVGATDETAREVLTTLANLGLPNEFVTRRLADSGSGGSSSTSFWLGSMLDQVQRIFGWAPNDLLDGNAKLNVDMQPAFAARFKIAKGRNEQRLSAYTVYAHYLAMLLIERLPEVEPAMLPGTAEEFYDAVAVKYEKLTLETALRYIWSLGIGVIPLRDEGTFDGAYWRVANRHVIALKPNTDASARWLFDLLHDFCHATQRPEDSDNAVIELPPNDPARLEDPDEMAANEFASDVTVAGQGDLLWDAAAEATEGKLPKLKAVLPKIARKVGVELGVAAYYMAHRLTTYGENWWGAASNLQPEDEQPWLVARDLLLENVDMQSMAPTDCKLIQAALRE